MINLLMQDISKVFDIIQTQVYQGFAYYAPSEHKKLVQLGVDRGMSVPLGKIEELLC